jgi:hypothetical protein
MLALTICLLTLFAVTGAVLAPIANSTSGVVVLAVAVMRRDATDKSLAFKHRELLYLAAASSLPLYDDR